jgi:hypothetical protein
MAPWQLDLRKTCPVNLRDAVEYVGDDDDGVYRGHPGRVADAGQLPHEGFDSFVNGPSWNCPPEQLRRLSEADSLARGRRLVSLLHPLEDRPVACANPDGEEWPSAREPVG